LTKLKLIFCTDGIFPYQIGGMQRHSRLLIEYLAKSGKVDLVVLHPHPHAVFTADWGVTEITIAPISKEKKYLRECYLYSKRVYAILMQHPGHIIYSQGLSVWYGIKNIKAPLIINPHGLESYQALTFKEKISGIPFIFIFNYLFAHATKVVSLGGKLTGILQSVIKDRSKIVILPNAVEIPGSVTIKSYETEKTNLLFVARFAYNKGIHILMEAFKQLNDEGYADKLELYLGGKGPLFDQYVNQYKFKNAHYLGFVSDEQLAGLYHSCDLFVLPTLFEGMPTVVLEALSYGMPVIVSDVGATAELITDSNGYLITKNSTKALKDSILQFLHLNRLEKQQLSANALQHVKKKYTWSIITEKHLELFNTLK
jgi:glycosyltransferase involved in cell wall biosynthesis